jgi:hypothetical protein
MSSERLALDAPSNAPMRRHLALLAAVSLAALLVDAQVERGVASGVVYVGVVALTVTLPGSRSTVAVAAAASFLTMLGFLLSPDVGELWKAGTGAAPETLD